MANSSESSISIGIYDDYLVVRKGLAAICSAFHHSCSEYSGVLDFLEQIRDRRHDLVVIGPNGSDAVQIVEAVQSHGRGVPTVLVLDLCDRIVVSNALREQVHGILLCSSPLAEFQLGIEAALKGRRYLSPPIADIVCDLALDHKSTDSITTREGQILRLLSIGTTTKEIAAQLTISLHTAQAHKRSLMRKLGASNQLSLVHRARLRRLL